MITKGCQMNTNDILDILSRTDKYISGQALADALGVSRQAVWKGIKSLRERGYGIDSVTNKGYRLSKLPDHLNASAINKYLRTKIIGSDLRVLDSVGSTNDYLKQLGNDGAPNGTVITTREQTKGKGRLGRTWQSAPDKNLAFSVLLRPKMTPAEVGEVTPLAGLAICKALREITELDCMIKWPNDVIVGRKKLVGILTEMSAEYDAVEYIVIGIGVNVDQSVFPEEISYKATSLLLETGRHFDKNMLLGSFLNSLEKEFTRTNLSLTRDVLDEYEKMCVTVGRSVTFRHDNRTLSGIAVGIAEGGRLKVMLSDGTIRKLGSGEVTVQGIY